MKAAIRAIEYHLPEERLTNEELSIRFPGWSPDKIEAKTGIVERRVAASDECASDLAAHAARRLFDSGACAPADIDYLVLCTQSPDYFLPTTACLLQDRLGLRTTVGAIDVNQGCSGYIYGLGIAKGLVESGQAERVLLLTAETYSKFINPGDKSVRALFGDAASATLITGSPDESGELLGPFVYGTDGRGGPNLIVPTGGVRRPREVGAAEIEDGSGNTRTVNDLYMNGAALFTFTLKVVPDIIARLEARSGKGPESIDRYCFHQANRYMLDHLRDKLRVPSEKFIIALSHCGNTVSSTIPIALKLADQRGDLPKGATVMLVGFGVGYSWGATLAVWPG